MNNLKQKSASLGNKDFAYDVSYQQCLKQIKFVGDRKKTTKCCVGPKVLKIEIRKHMYIYIYIPSPNKSLYGEDKRRSQ